MSAIEITAVVIALILVGIISFFAGRRMNIDTRDLVRQLNEEHEQQLSKKQAELDAYRDKVHAHFDKTAGLFVNMAGSYKDLFDHLSAGYDQLGELGIDKKLPDRAGALLDGPEADAQPTQTQSGMPEYKNMNATAGGSKDD
ncbi:protein of unknown function DUF1043 [Methylophaga frappieri]|uniref:Z-ring associated protein G n=1 Tax=Methylophaga frappieri (strain ATCC BAA-2434 / DSM 25690 / JAM7) TaxID=754477 RepID=I1YH89_METFJ|nr:DUF1043 family protein [Methylophaga frappieri]AFJ02282.1 protein of unknown function DUF1043 [Methylophaga frappieri]